MDIFLKTFNQKFCRALFFSQAPGETKYFPQLSL